MLPLSHEMIEAMIEADDIEIGFIETRDRFMTVHMFAEALRPDEAVGLRVTYWSFNH